MAAGTYSIKEISALTGLPASTLRYYESAGIINPVKRDTSSRQRVYSEQDLESITGIACLNAIGMSLDEMRTYLKNYKEGGQISGRQIELLLVQERRLKVESRLLKIRQEYVALKIAYWQALAEGRSTEAVTIAKQARLFIDTLKLRNA